MTENEEFSKLTFYISTPKAAQVKRDLNSYNYDYCLLDCPPSLGILTVNALGSADMILIPVKTELAAQRTIRLILKTVEVIQDTGLNPNLEILTILPTLYDSRNVNHRSQVGRTAA